MATSASAHRSRAATRPRAAWPPIAAAPHHRRRRAAFGNYQVLNSLLRFDTSPLPDNATVSSVKLRGYLTSVADDDDRTLIGEWYSAANWPIDPERLDAHPTTALPGTDITSLNKNSTVELTLANPSSLSLTGYSSSASASAAANPTPTTTSNCHLEHPSRDEPQLIVSYSTPGGASPPVNSSPPVVSGVAQVGSRCRRRRGRGRGRRRSRTRISGSAVAPVVLISVGRAVARTRWWGRIWGRRCGWW